MMKNYRRIGSTSTPYISGLGSGKSQGSGEGISVTVKESLKLTLINFNFRESISIGIKDKFNQPKHFNSLKFSEEINMQVSESLERNE